MREVLISIQPKWCELIASGKKTVEVRKTKPKIEVPFKGYIYCTQGDALAVPCLNFPRYTIHRVNNGKLYGRRMTLEEREKNDYSYANGKVIGEFVCQTILKYECEFVDDDCYENIVCIGIDEDGGEIGFTAWSNDGDEPYEDTFLYKTSRVEYEELKKYIGLGFGTFYGWHISDLVIYDKPKVLSEFRYYNPTVKFENGYPIPTHEIKRPPQSWCYVEGGEG